MSSKRGVRAVEIVLMLPVYEDAPDFEVVQSGDNDPSLIPTSLTSLTEVELTGSDNSVLSTAL